MTTPLTFLNSQSLDRRNLIKGAAALAATAVTMKAASAATVTPFGQSGALTPITDPLPLGPLSGFSPGVSQKAQGFVRACRFPSLRWHHGG